MAAPIEERELQLVDKVDFNIINASNNEEKLTKLLSTYLAPLLLKAGSPHQSVRNKVIGIAGRLKTFIQPPGIVLNVEALLEQYKRDDVSPIVKHFDLMFIQHSINRLTIVQRRDLLAKAVKGIGSDKSPGLNALFHVILRILVDVKLPSRGSQEDEAFRDASGLSDPRDAEFVATWLGKLLLLRPQTESPGLTEMDVAFLTIGKPETWDNSNKDFKLADVRIKVVQFLASGAFTDDERVLPAIYAAASTDFRVSGPGEDMLKRSTVDLEDKNVVRKLFDAHTRSGLPPPYRVRILGLLSRSETSAEFSQDIIEAFRLNVGLTEHGEFQLLNGLLTPEMLAAVRDSASRAAPATHPNRTQANASQRLNRFIPDTTATLVPDLILPTSATGLEQTKLHRALFEFINWIARVGTRKKAAFEKIGPPLVKSLRSYIQSQGWPKPAKSLSLEENVLRSRAYEAIGSLARGTTISPEEGLILADWLFRSLVEDPTPDVVVNIDGALSTLTVIFKPPHGEALTKNLRNMLFKYFKEPDPDPEEEGGRVIRSARHAVVKWANNCLPYSDVFARWIDVLAVGRRDERNDVVEEGRKGLDPWTYYNMNNDTTLPDWADLVYAYFREVMGASELEQADREGSMEVDQRDAFANFAGQDASLAVPVAIEYCKRMLFLTIMTKRDSADQAIDRDFTIEPNWQQQLEALVQTDKSTRQTIRKYFLATSPDALRQLLESAFAGILREDLEVAEPCARAFVEVASFAPQDVLTPLARRSGEALSLVRSNKREMRALGAKAYGILAAHPENDDKTFEAMRCELVATTKNLSSAVGSELNAVEGAFVALAHLVSRRRFYTGAEFDLDALPILISVDSTSPSLHSALFEAYTQLWTAGVWTNGIGKDVVAEASVAKNFVGKDTATKDAAVKDSVASAYIDPLMVQAKKGNERAITALGRLAIAFPHDDTIDLVLEKLYSLYEIKQAEVHFAVGEAITATVACWDADVVELTLDVDAAGKSFYIGKRADRINAVLNKLLTDCKTTKPSLLKASGIWLFCLIQHCSHLPEIQSRLRESQVAFMRLLSGRDELVQETASRGLTLVYERGDPALKDDLVRDLVASFTGSGPQLKVEDDTELFDAGALPTGEGKSVTSYKDIVSLANEVGDQSLVYKFMSLATNAATWSTRSAFGRFGLSSILSESEIDPKLYPKLYRYRFDPNSNVQRSMNDIWKAIVKDSSAVIEEHFDAIMTDLLKSILGKEWRVREASCAAISDLVSGRPFPKYEKYYKDIWTCALKVLDDVKGTVRNAALSLCLGLANTLERQLEDSATSHAAAAMIKEAIPFLLSDRVIESDVQDVKLLATHTVISIAKKGGSSLKPFIPTIITKLLGLLSSIEPDALNYHYQKSDADTKDKIDKLRTQFVSRSPLSEAIENLLAKTDSAVLAELIPQLENTMKGAIAMPTKVGCSRVLITLATRHANDFRPYAARFLAFLERKLLEVNDEVSSNYARAAAYVLRPAPDDARLSFAAHLVTLYMSSENDTRRQKVADAIASIAKVSSDHFTQLETQLMPLVFLARHDEDPYVAKLLESVWDNNGGGTTIVRRLLPEIEALTNRTLDTAQWALRHAGALASAAAVDAVTREAALTGLANMASLKAAWPAFERALALKTFDRKDKVLAALPAFVKESKGWWEEDKTFAATLWKIAVREAKRNNNTYRPHALEVLWKVAAERDDIDGLDEIAAVAKPFFEDEEKEDPDKMDVDSVGGRKIDARTTTTWRAIEAVVMGFNRPKMRSDPAGVLGKVAELLSESEAKIKSPIINRSALDAVRRAYWYGCVKNITTVASEGGKSTSEAVWLTMKWWLSTLDLDGTDIGTEDQRLARTKAVKAVIEAGGVKAVKEVREKIERALKEERSAVVKGAWSEVLEAMK